MPIPSGDGTQKLILYHPNTGTYLEIVNNRNKAVDRWIPYLQQIWDVNEQNARELAERDVSRQWVEDDWNGKASVVRRICRNGKVGPRGTLLYGNPDDMYSYSGVRLTKQVDL